MATSGGVNPVQNDFNELYLNSIENSVEFRREPPPPYSLPQGILYSSTRIPAPTEPVSPVTTQPVVHQTVIVQAPLKDGPVFYNCPICQNRIMTKVKYENSTKTHLIAGFICGFTSWCCLCCLSAIPYLVSTCKKTEHYCPNCETKLGTYSKI